jgi:fumarate reductase (CoM/CoB) subunit A
MEVVDGLFVAGEAAWGVHGANRLGGNALAETQVFGHLAALSMLGAPRRLPPLGRWAGPTTSGLRRRRGGSSSRRESVASIREDMQRVMSRDVGLERSAQSLERASEAIEALAEKERDAVAEPHFHGVAARLECRYMLRLASLVTRAAALRKETRGAHVRSDFPAESDDPATTVLSCSGADELRPV